MGLCFCTGACMHSGGRCPQAPTIDPYSGRDFRQNPIHHVPVPNPLSEDRVRAIVREELKAIERLVRQGNAWCDDCHQRLVDCRCP